MNPFFLDGLLGTRKVRKVDSFSHDALVYGGTDARKPYVRMNAFALRSVLLGEETDRIE
jgi:hypothetical protein